MCEGNEGSIFDCAEHGNGLSPEVCAASGLPEGCSSPEDRDCINGCEPNAALNINIQTLSPGMCPT